ncbi:TadE/TadG family type IV pilus assembly protein [Paraburkholderia phosphatilytica]|uniref:TadE/TadG family type IV pilus assembly protein n=1 Tax=Paraburkholderia phosphatilytica TaxID=2282883 RepID=UPI000E4E5156|nr:TadE/TadG family type IV pilus assembly protein [Paraburkholderia phosphatilytica]
MSAPGTRTAVRRYASKRRIGARHRARGATAVEFALLFPLFFLVLYAIVTYSLIFVAEQSLTLAAEEGARAALAYQDATTLNAALDARASAACTAAANVSSWLANRANCTATPAACSYDASLDCIEVTMNYDYAASPLVPTLPLLGIALPSTLSSSSTVQLNPENIL